MSSITALDLAFATGILINSIKGADLLLRPHQQKRIQDWAEVTTLRLEYARPLRWFSKLATPRGTRILLLIGVAEFFFVGVTVGTVQAISKETNLHERLLQVGALLLSAVCIPYIVSNAGPRLVTWLFKKQSIMSFALRFVVLLMGGFAFFMLYQAALIYVGWITIGRHTKFFDYFDSIFDETSRAAVFDVVGLLLVWPFFTMFWIITQVGGLAMWCAAAVGVAEITLKFLRGLAWRIIEFNKGAYAALTLILTVVIGLADFVVRSHHQR